MEWAMLASILAPYIISAFKGDSGTGTGQADPQAQIDSNAIRTELLRQIQNQNRRYEGRQGLDEQLVSLMQSLMPSRASGLISPGAYGSTTIVQYPNVPRQLPENPTPGRVYPSGPESQPSAPSTTGDGSSQGTRVRLPGSGHVNALAMPEFMFPGWLDTLPTYQQAAKARRR